MKRCVRPLVSVTWPPGGMTQDTYRGVWMMEINAQPERLDLDDAHARIARDLGVMLVICSDAHHTSELHWMGCGVDQARRGWLKKRM